MKLVKYIQTYGTHRDDVLFTDITSINGSEKVILDCSVFEFLNYYQ